MRRLKIAYLVGSCLWGLAAAAAPTAYRCPSEINTTQSLATAIPDWTAMNDEMNGHQSLEQVSLFDGPPREGASLVPDNEGSRKDPRWNFSHPLSRPIYMVCFYSQSSVRLMRELPTEFKECTLHYLKNPKRPDSLTCR